MSTLHTHRELSLQGLDAVRSSLIANLNHQDEISFDDILRAREQALSSLLGNTITDEKESDRAIGFAITDALSAGFGRAHRSPEMTPSGRPQPCSRFSDDTQPTTTVDGTIDSLYEQGTMSSEARDSIVVSTSHDPLPFRRLANRRSSILDPARYHSARDWEVGPQQGYFDLPINKHAKFMDNEVDLLSFDSPLDDNSPLTPSGIKPLCVEPPRGSIYHTRSHDISITTPSRPPFLRSLSSENNPTVSTASSFLTIPSSPTQDEPVSIQEQRRPGMQFQLSSSFLLVNSIDDSRTPPYSGSPTPTPMPSSHSEELVLVGQDYFSIQHTHQHPYCQPQLFLDSKDDDILHTPSKTDAPTGFGVHLLSKWQKKSNKYAH
ncbi:unnamed protein product [Sympodiomycopsis kandeliae]